MVSKSSIDKFFNSKFIAFVGVSSDEKKFSRSIYSELKAKNYNLIPVNPNVSEINGTKCYSALEEIPEKPDSVFISTPKSSTSKIVESALKLGIENIWIQQMAETDEAIEIANKSEVNLIAKECIMMYAEPVKSIHKFHKILWKVIGKHAK